MGLSAAITALRIEARGLDTLSQGQDSAKNQGRVEHGRGWDSNQMIDSDDFDDEGMGVCVAWSVIDRNWDVIERRWVSYMSG